MEAALQRTVASKTWWEPVFWVWVRYAKKGAGTDRGRQGIMR